MVLRLTHLEVRYGANGSIGANMRLFTTVAGWSFRRNRMGGVRSEVSSSTGKPLFVIAASAVVLLTAFILFANILFSKYKQAADMQRQREEFLDFFAATAKWITFSVPLDNDVAALAVIDRITDHRRLILSGSTFLAFPRFSADGERVLVVRGKQTTAGSELLSCTISDWNCRVLTRAVQPILWPVEVRKDVVLYVGSEAYDDGRRRHYDFYLIDSSLPPVRLSTFELYNLNALNVVDDKIIFSTSGSVSRNNVIFPKPVPLARASSEIFMLHVDWKERRLIIPSRQLEPLYVINGFSTLPTTSEDGANVAFLNRRLTAGLDRYNLVVAKIDGTIQKYVDSTTTRFSRPAFVGSAVLANQLFENRYETTLVDVPNNSTRQIAVFDNTPGALESLKRVEIRIPE
jgi:hypothetical protein